VGTSYLIVNPAKREYLEPRRFGEDDKFSNLLRGEHCLLAFKRLLSEGSGAWAGEPIILVGDHSDLWETVSTQFTNISYRALAQLCRYDDIRKELAAKARENESFLIDLGSVIEQYAPLRLEHDLNEALGQPWRRAFSRAMTKIPWYWRLPPID
jgi:hypothetical protein